MIFRISFLAVFFLMLVGDFIPLVCPVFKVFDIHCPTCGLGRSLVFLMKGEFRQSFSHHPFGLFVVIGICLFILSHRFRQQIEILLLKKWLLGTFVFLYICWGFLLRQTDHLI